MSFFSKTPTVSADDARIRELLTRGVERIYPSAEFLEKRLKSGERLSLYLGIDPTGPSLHIGHLIPLLKLRQFQELGHTVILLIGDFTCMIGDPTDKNAARKQLSREDVLANAQLYKEQAGRIIRFEGENSAKLRHNSEWLGKLSFAEGLTLCSQMTYTQAIKRDMFQKRISEGKDIFLHELLYPLLQGYDSVVMAVDGEVGGNDQTFNMLAGRDLMKKLKNKEKFVISMKLLTDPTGKKMGKTVGDMVAFSDTPNDCFGKIMSWPDSMILSGFELCTTLPLEKVEEIKRVINPKEQKMELAYWIVRMLYDREHAVAARDNFTLTFSERRIPENVKTVRATEYQLLIEVFQTHGIISSKSEFRRLAEEGAITRRETGEKVTEDIFPAKTGTYRIGKHRFLKIERE